MDGPASHSGPVRWLLAHDPELDALTKAVKLAVVTCVALWLSVDLIDDPSVATFAAFGSVALLLFADFPGDRSARLGAYLLLTAVGALLIVAGTLASRTPWLAVASMAVVGFAIIFSGVLSAAVAGAGRAGLLAFVLPVTIAAGPDEIGARLAGWAIAAVLAIPVAVFVRPPPDHRALRSKASVACAALAGRLDGAVADPAPDADAAVNALRTQYDNAAIRPVGLTTGNQLVGRLVSQLTWLRSVSATVPSDRPPPGGPAGRLLAACASVLKASADVLRQPSKAEAAAGSRLLATGLAELDAARSAAVAAIRFEPGTGPAGNSVPAVGGLDGLAPATAHELAYTSAGVGATVAGIAAADGRSLIDRVLGRHRPDALTGSIAMGRRRAVGQASLDSVWFQNALRGAVGLAAAVLIAELTHVSHGFWVVLGTMSVLRTSALTTGATAVRALLGTFVGFLVGAGLVQLLGTSPGPLWAILPFVIVVAGFLPEAVSFVAGQAAFTVFVVILFNIVQPDGWQVGLVRVEDVALGCVAGLVCGVLLWPRGASVALRRALGAAYRAAAGALVAATVRTADAADAQDSARAASQRLDAAMRTYLTERAGRRLPVADLATAVTGAERVRLVAGAILSLDAAADLALAQHARRSAEWLAAAAAALESGEGPIDPAWPADAEKSVLRHLAGSANGTAGEALDRSAWAVGLYLDDAARLEERVTPALVRLTTTGEQQS